MDLSLYNQWVQREQQQQLHSETSQPQPQLTRQEARPSPLDDWAKDRPTPITQPAGPQSPQAPSLDISEFTTIDDIGDSVAAPPMTTPSTSTIPSPPSTYYYHHPFYAPFNAMPYGATWSSATSLPLSSYSTLNGATSTASLPTVSSSASSASQSQSQQQASSSSAQSMVIDPALTMGASPSSGNTPQTQHYSTQAPFSSQSLQPQPPAQQSRSPYQYAIHPQMYNLSSAFYQPQQHHTPQGTLSPQALHSSSILTTISPAHFYASPSQSQAQHPQSQVQQSAQPHATISTSVSTPTSTASANTTPPSTTSTAPTPPSGPTVQDIERKERFHNALKPLLQPTAFSGAQAVQSLVQRIDDYGPQDVEPPVRLEILTKIRDGAGNHYFRAWSENSTAIDITREWLKAAFTAKSDSALVETIMPILHIIDRLPMTVESLKASKLGKIVVKLVKEPPSPAIKDMASNVERRWRQLVSGAEGAPKTADTNGAEDVKSKKRKTADPPLVKAAPPPKKPAVGTATSVKPIMPTTAFTAALAGTTKKTAVKDAKSDFSFFSAPKPKPKLPSFKKAPPPPVTVKKEPDSNVAQPSSVDPFQEALKAMAAKSKKDSSTTPTPTPPPGTGNTPPLAGQTQLGQGDPAKNGKKKKSVTWAADDQLESIRIIEKAIYEDDESVDGQRHTLHQNLRDLDRGEGAALHAHPLFEELIDWTEPMPIEIPMDIEFREHGKESQEKLVQEQREQNVLSAVYAPTNIPDTPGEPTTTLPEEEVDKNVKVMVAGAELEAVWWGSNGVPPAGTAATVAELMSQLVANNMGSIDPTMAAVGSGLNGQGGLDPTSQIPTGQPSQQELQRLLAQLSATAPAGMYGGQNGSSGVGGPDPSSYMAVDQPWSGMGQYPTDYGQGYPDERERWDGGVGGRGGPPRGRGRGRGRGGRDEGGYRHNKRKPCSFFAAGRCKFGDQCDFAHEILS